MTADELAQLRYENALALYDEFVRATVRHPEARPLRGLDGLFAERLQIQPSYWSQIKARSRQIGERLARQFEQRCAKPSGWLDQRHDGQPTPAPVVFAPDGSGGSATPLDEDERFVVGLVLSYYRRDPLRARLRLLQMIGEALHPPAAGAAGGAAAPGPTSVAPGPAPGSDDELWSKTRDRVAPLKRKR